MAISNPGPLLGYPEAVKNYPGIAITIHLTKTMYSLFGRYYVSYDRLTSRFAKVQTCIRLAFATLSI